MMGDENRAVTVSVIMVSYNHGKYIEQAIESVLAQETSFSYELLIGDDASTDDTPAILKKYEAEYPDIIRVFLSQRNQGITKNAYHLFQEAKGKYLASCESDDYWTDPSKLQTQVDFLERHPSFIGCFHRVRCVNQDGTPARRQRVHWISEKRYFRLSDFKGVILPGHSSSIVRRNLFLNPQHDYSVFYRAHPLIGDRTSAVIFLSQGDFYQFPNVMSCYRRDGFSITKRLYPKGRSPILEELEYESQLEIYARNVFQADIGAEAYRRELLASAVWQYLKNRDSDSKNCVKAVLAALERPKSACLLLPWHMLKKFMRRYVFRNSV